MALLHQGAGQQLDQVDGHHRHVARAKDGDPSLPGVLQQSKLLSQRVDPIESRQIKGPGHRGRQDGNPADRSNAEALGQAKTGKQRSEIAVLRHHPGGIGGLHRFV